MTRILEGDKSVGLSQKITPTTDRNATRSFNDRPDNTDNKLKGDEIENKNIMC